MSVREGPFYSTDYPWGSWAVPTNPRGWYKPFTQFLDAVGLPRVFPAKQAQAAHLIAKGDKWWSDEFHRVISSMLVGQVLAPFGVFGNVWDTFTHLYLTLHAVGYISYPFYWDVLWCLFYDSSRAEPWFVTQSRIQAPNTTTDLTSGAIYPYDAAPWSSQLVPVRSLAISNGCFFGDPWDNGV